MTKTSRAPKRARSRKIPTVQQLLPAFVPGDHPDGPIATCYERWREFELSEHRDAAKRSQLEHDVGFSMSRTTAGVLPKFGMALFIMANEKTKRWEGLLLSAMHDLREMAEPPSLSSYVKRRADTYWKARAKHLATMERTESDAATDKSGRAMQRALLGLCRARTVTTADLAAQAQALYSDSVAIAGEYEIRFPNSEITIPALFKAIERATGFTVCKAPRGEG